MLFVTPSEKDTAYMRQALELAKSVLFLTDPNPRVGCVIVKDDQVIGRGATQKVGGAHAEIMAIQDALSRQSSLEGSTFYVTLEPCSHYGRTPPCVDALLQHRPARVVIATLDPNPLVRGKGIAKLQQAGIEVVYPVLAEQAMALNPGFMSRMGYCKVWTWTKLACTLDGKLALNNGESLWITSPAAREDGQVWRARSSVVLTGIGTILRDNPLLNVRAFATERQPVRAVIDGRLQMPLEARLLNGEPILIFTYTENPDKEYALSQKGVQIVKLAKKGHHLDLKEVWQVLVEHGFNEVHVEAGARLNGALLEAGLIDEVLVYMAPKIMGPGQEMFASATLSSLEDIYYFEWIEQTRIGDDLRLRLLNTERWNALMKLVK